MKPFQVLRMASGPPPLDTQTIVTGSTGTTPDRIRGFNVTGPLGSCSDGTSDLYGGAAIRRLEYLEGGGSASSFTFEVTGTRANSGWTTLTSSHGEALARASATFTQTGGNTQWTWTSVGTVANNPAIGNPTFTWT